MNIIIFCRIKLYFFALKTNQFEIKRREYFCLSWTFFMRLHRFFTHRTSYKIRQGNIISLFDGSVDIDARASSHGGHRTPFVATISHPPAIAAPRRLYEHSRRDNNNGCVVSAALYIYMGGRG